VVLHGGVEVKGFLKDGQTADGLTIWSVDLAAAGLSTLAATSGIFQSGWKCANGDRTELFFGGSAMTLARHPNKAKDGATPDQGTWQYLRQGAVVTPTSFTAGTDDTDGGKAIPADAPFLKGLGKGAVAHGYFSWDWADSFANVSGVQSDTVDLTAAPA